MDIKGNEYTLATLKGHSKSSAHNNIANWRRWYITTNTLLIEGWGNIMKDRFTQLKVVEVEQDTVNDINTMDNTFEVRTKAVPELRDGAFSYTVEEVPVPYTKSSPDDDNRFFHPFFFFKPIHLYLQNLLYQ
jgi:hypothetical protein